MKKSLSFTFLIVLAIACGLWLGLILFGKDEQIKPTAKTPAPVFREKIQKDSLGASKSETIKTKKSNLLSKKSLPPQHKWQQALSEIYINLDEIRNQCEQVIENEFSNQDYLDIESGFYKDPEKYEIMISVLNKLQDSAAVTSDVDDKVDDYLKNSNFNTSDVRTIFDRQNICNSMEVNNMTGSLIRALAMDKNMPVEKKRIYAKKLLDISERYIYKYKRIEYTFSSMEIIFSLVDSELVSKDYLVDMDLIREDMISYVQNYESYIDETEGIVAREEIRNYRKSISDSNEAIKVLIEKLRSEIPN